jgi:hypothetical protein
MSASKPHGMAARFESPEALLQAARSARSAGYKRFDAYTPFPVHGLAEVLRAEDARLPWLVFLCGALGAAAGYGLQYFVSVIDYPLNIGGRPLHSWPSFIPVTFETTVLLAAFGAVFGMFALNGLPRPHHPVFNVPGFGRASSDAFFLCIEADDPRYDRVEVERLLREWGAADVVEVQE